MSAKMEFLCPLSALLLQGKGCSYAILNALAAKMTEYLRHHHVFFHF